MSDREMVARAAKIIEAEMTRRNKELVRIRTTMPQLLRLIDRLDDDVKALVFAIELLADYETDWC